MAAARAYRGGGPPRWSSMALWSALSLLPDADVVGFALGVQYGDPWGHRGASHSLAFSAALGLAIGLAAPRFRRPAVRTALMAILVLASHAALDTMTDGGLGCALLWPFDLTRYFSPWRPIPVAPIGLAFFTPSGAMVALIELVLFSPVFLLARSRQWRVTRAAMASVLVLWLVAAWLICSRDPLREAAVGLALKEDTSYASGFSEHAFRTIAPGTRDSDVRLVLGAPVGETWFFSPEGQPFEPAAARSAASLPDQCLTIIFETGSVKTALDRDACRLRGVESGMSRADVERVLGTPTESCWRYSWSPRNRRHRLRMVCFLSGRVESVVRQWN